VIFLRIDVKVGGDAGAEHSESSLGVDAILLAGNGDSLTT